MNTMQIRLMGVRGSLPVNQSSTLLYGGATSCVFVRAGAEVFILDAGSGLRGDAFAAFSQAPHFTMLLSHAHADHLLGFPMFSPFFNRGRCADIYLKTRAGLDARAQIEALMAPPLWPIRTDALQAALRFCDVPPCFSVGDVTVEAMEVRHPGGCTAYKLSYHGVSLVYATDIEAQDDESSFIAFAKNCSLLLLDAQYSPEEYHRTRGFGHTYTARSISLAEECGAENTIFIHHDPTRTDDTLTQWDEALAAQHPTMHFGREGEEVFL